MRLDDVKVRVDGILIDFDVLANNLYRTSLVLARMYVLISYMDWILRPHTNVRALFLLSSPDKHAGIKYGVLVYVQHTVEERVILSIPTGLITSSWRSRKIFSRMLCKSKVEGSLDENEPPYTSSFFALGFCSWSYYSERLVMRHLPLALQLRIPADVVIDQERVFMERTGDWLPSSCHYTKLSRSVSMFSKWNTFRLNKVRSCNIPLHADPDYGTDSHLSCGVLWDSKRDCVRLRRQEIQNHSLESELESR